MPSQPRPPTYRQVEVMVAMLEAYQSENDWPTQRALCERLGIRSASALPYLEALIKKGLAERIPGKNHRNIALTERGLDVAREFRQPRLL